jgi:ubiquinone/menaquinone biosynthesis C-methylase UbiE
MSKAKDIIRDKIPSGLWRAMSGMKRAIMPRGTKGRADGQDLGLYWDEDMAKLLDVWGEGSTWREIEFLMTNCRGRALDIACGTGKVIEMLGDNEQLEIHGCDISDVLISKAVARGIFQDRLRVCDATQLPYSNAEFDYSYSIGSLEHFTVEGIEKFVAEAARVTRVGSFHMMPVSRSGLDEGWLKTYQTFHNSSPAWWVSYFEKHFKRVKLLDSSWNDRISLGKWFLCYH